MSGAENNDLDENARLRAELRALQERFSALDASSSRRIQALTDENEILAEANRLLMEREEASKQASGSGSGGGDPAAVPSLLHVPDELLLPGAALQVSEVAALDNAHAFGNLLSVAGHPTRPALVLTGGVDKSVCLHDWQQRRRLAGLQLSAPVLSLAFNPRPELADYFVAGCMDAVHGLYRLVEEEEDTDGAWRIDTVRQFHDHTRHGTLRVAWSSSGVLFATGSSDKSLHLYKCSLPLVGGGGSETASAEPCEKIKSFFFNGTVEAIAFAPLPSAFEVAQQESSTVGGSDVVEAKEVVVIAVRDDCYVHYVDCSTMEKERVNMNKDGIEHVSYTIMDLRLSPTAKYLLAATDTNRLFIFAVKSNTILRNFYGHKAGPYSQPRAMWHPSEKYVIANSEDGGAVFVWSIASERVVETIAAHEALVRDLAVSSAPGDEQTMMTVSYDKRVKIWQLTMESDQLLF